MRAKHAGVMFDVKDKTPVYIVRGGRFQPAHINGTLKTRRDNGIGKALVYYLDKHGIERIDLLSIKSIREREFTLEG